MLPAPRRDTASLGDVLTSALSALRGESNRLDLPAVRSAAVILVDGLGASLLAQRSGHARHLSSALPRQGGTILSAFPTTTASALATLTTGLPPGQHGMVGYSVVDPETDRVVNQLSGWDARTLPERWQSCPTLFETAAAAGLEPLVVASARYEESGFTRAVLRGASFVAAGSIADRLELTRELLADGSASRLIYTYIPELDMAGHAAGSASSAWTARLEELDAALATFAPPADTGALLTADHGMLDIPPHARRVISADDSRWEGVRHVAGEPRCLHLTAEHPDAVAGILARWQERESTRAWVVTRDDAIDADWFGEVRPKVRARIGDVIVAARSAVVYYDERSATTRALAMVGQHGSFSPEETRVPLARFGAFAQA